MVDQSSPVTTSEQQAVPVAHFFPDAAAKLGKLLAGSNVVADDARTLVIAAREFWDPREDGSPESRALLAALEAFSSRVPYEDEPASLPCKSGEGAEALRWGLDADAVALLKRAATFLDSAAGEGIELDGIDAMDLVTDLHELVDVNPSNCFHEDATLFLDGKILGTEPEVVPISSAVEALIAWARDNQAFPVGNPGGCGRGHIDENECFVLRDLVTAIDSTPSEQFAKSSPDAETSRTAADLLEQYAGFIRSDVKADELERHPYLPLIEQTVEDLRATSSPDAAGSGGEAFPDIGTDPMKGDRVDRIEQSVAACREAYVKQQKGVPDQTALVWRWHLGALLECATRLNAILSRPDATQTREAELVERYRHVKRGTVYEVIGRAELQVNNIALTDGVAMVVYRGEDGKLWARGEAEFRDGRFELVAPSDDTSGAGVA